MVLPRAISLIVVLLLLVRVTGAASNDVIVIPPLEVSTVDGGMLTDRDLQGPLVLLFTLPGSISCKEATALIQAASGNHPDVDIYLVTLEDSPALQEMLVEQSLTWPVILDEIFLLTSVLDVGRVPTACLIEEGRLVGRLDRGFTAEELADAPADPFGNLESEDEPAIPARDVVVGFHKLQEPMFLMFAGAECSYCHYMLPSVFEIAAFMDTAIVVTGEDADLEPFDSDAARLSIFLDPQWELASAFGIHTVPTVFFIDTDGTIVWTHAGIVEGLPIIANVFLRRVGE